VFDTAGTIVLSDVADGRELRRWEVHIEAGEPFLRARVLRGLGVQVLICGAVSLPSENALVSSGIMVIPCTCGRLDEVLDAYLEGRLNGDAFLMPGCDSRVRMEKTGGGAHAGRQPGSFQEDHPHEDTQEDTHG